MEIGECLLVLLTIQFPVFYLQTKEGTPRVARRARRKKAKLGEKKAKFLNNAKFGIL